MRSSKLSIWRDLIKGAARLQFEDGMAEMKVGGFIKHSGDQESSRWLVPRRWSQTKTDRSDSLRRADMISNRDDTTAFELFAAGARDFLKRQSLPCSDRIWEDSGPRERLGFRAILAPALREFGLHARGSSMMTADDMSSDQTAELNFAPKLFPGR